MPEKALELRASGPAYGREYARLIGEIRPAYVIVENVAALLGRGLELFSETWPRSGLMRNGIAYQLPPLVRLTDAIGSGLLPTPAAIRTGQIRRRRGARGPVRPSLDTMARHGLWPTPTAKANMMAPSMQKWAAHRNLWPTPTTRDWRS